MTFASDGGFVVNTSVGRIGGAGSGKRLPFQTDGFANLDGDLPVAATRHGGFNLDGHDAFAEVGKVRGDGPRFPVANGLFGGADLQASAGIGGFEADISDAAIGPFNFVIIGPGSTSSFDTFAGQRGNGGFVGGSHGLLARLLGHGDFEVIGVEGKPIWVTSGFVVGDDELVFVFAFGEFEGDLPDVALVPF